MPVSRRNKSRKMKKSSRTNKRSKNLKNSRKNIRKMSGGAGENKIWNIDLYKLIAEIKRSRSQFPEIIIDIDDKKYKLFIKFERTRDNKLYFNNIRYYNPDRSNYKYIDVILQDNNKIDILENNNNNIFIIQFNGIKELPGLNNNCVNMDSVEFILGNTKYVINKSDCTTDPWYTEIGRKSECVSDVNGYCSWTIQKTKKNEKNIEGKKTQITDENLEEIISKAQPTFIQSILY